MLMSHFSPFTGVCVCVCRKWPHKAEQRGDAIRFEYNVMSNHFTMAA